VSHAQAHTHPHRPPEAGAGPADRTADRRRLGWTLALVVAYMFAEVLGGLWTGSLALVADAGHMLADAGSLALALFALAMAGRPRTAERTFGYHRTEILAALVQGAALVAIAVFAVFVVVEAWERLGDPPEVAGGPMLAIAVGGLAVHGLALRLLHGGRHGSLNLRGAWLHVAADALGSVGAIAAGVAIWAFGWRWADPAASLAIALLVVWSSWTLLRDSVGVLMEATPRHIDAGRVKEAIAEVDGVEEVHDLHVWTITSGFESLSVHARVAGRDRDEALGEVRELVRERFGIAHSTIQIEEGEGCEAGRCD